MKYLLISFFISKALGYSLIKEVPNSENKIALTFDACSSRTNLSAYDQRITKILLKTKTPATFFLGGKWIKNGKDKLTSMFDNALFEIANHSWDHYHFKKLSSLEIKNQIQKTQQAIFNISGKISRYVRPPYGEYDERVIKTIDSMGLKTILYSVVSGDPDPNITRGKLINWVINETKTGSIIIMHINKKGRFTAEALPEIIHKLKKRGFKFVTITNLLNSKTKN